MYTSIATLPAFMALLGLVHAGPTPNWAEKHHDQRNHCKSDQVVACCNGANEGVLLGANCISVPVCKSSKLPDCYEITLISIHSECCTVHPDVSPR